MSWRVVACGAVLLTACAGAHSASATPRATSSPSFAGASPATPLGASSPQPSRSSTSSPPATLSASYARAKTAPAAPGSAAGTITGHLGAPCECLPPFDVYAITTDGRQFYVTQSVEFQTAYTMVGVAAGDYFVMAAGRGAITDGQAATAQRRFQATYSKAIPCGLSAECTDHSLLAVHVRAGETIANIDPNDFYGPPFDSYPLVPTAGPAAPSLGTPPATFSTAEAAAIFLGRVSTAARYVSTPADCPPNVACFWFTSHAAGSQAAYYVGAGGSNQNSVPCNFYLTGTGANWKTFDHTCGFSNFPAVGATGGVHLRMGETGCVNVHSSPSVTAGVVACLNAGSTVTIDQGPYYVPTGAQDTFIDYWWHIAGKGWMVHAYLRNG